MKRLPTFNGKKIFGPCKKWGAGILACPSQRWVCRLAGRYARSRGISILLCFAFFSAPLPAFASHKPGYDTCRESIDWLAWKEQRIFRARLFGLKKARDAGISEVRFAKDKSIWIKTQAGGSASSIGGSPTVDEWRSVSEGYPNVTWYNPLMDSQGDIKPQDGIFGVRRRLTSELVPHIAQAYRSFECRIEGICDLLRLSELHDEHTPQSVTVKVLGCEDIPSTTFPSCHLQTESTPTTTQGDIRQYCDTMVATLRERETQVVKLVVEYDAGYRSMLQLSGILRSFLGEMRGTVLGSLRNATDLITSLGRIPCFTGSCDDATDALINASSSSASAASATSAPSSGASTPSSTPSSSPSSPSPGP